MPEKNQGKSTQSLFTMLIVLLLVVIIGIQIWYMLGMKKQLDTIQAEYNAIQALTQQTTGKNEGAAETINTPVQTENKTPPVQQDQAVQELAPQKNAAPAIEPALPNDSPSNSPFYAQPWDPYEDLRRMQRHMDRTFNNRQNTYHRPDFEYHFSQNISVPEMDVREDNRKYIVFVNMPGSDEKNISVNLNGQRLTVRGKQVQEKQDRDPSGRFVFSERRSGRFQRSITLRAPVEEKGMKTRIDNGVLTIIIPKKKQQL